MDNLNWKKGDLEVRTVTRFDGSSHVELVKWEGQSVCITIAYFIKDSDGNVTLRFVGNRPFKEIAEIDVNDVWKELWLTCMLLEGKDE